MLKRQWLNLLSMINWRSSEGSALESIKNLNFRFGIQKCSLTEVLWLDLPKRKQSESSKLFLFKKCLSTCLFFYHWHFNFWITIFFYVPEKNSAPIIIVVRSKSLYMSQAVSNLYGTENEISASFGPVGSILKKNLG